MSNRIRIITTSDVHGKVMPHSYADGHELDLGFAKIAGLIDGLGRENTILVDNGDTLEGSPLQSCFFRNGREKTSPVTTAMRLMKYDYINIGNHDFDFGMDALRAHIDGTGAVCINLNLGFNYDIKEVAGNKIAFFGVTTHFTPKWEREENIKGAVFQDAFELARETAKKIKADENPDFIVCCYHGGLERNPFEAEGANEDAEASGGENQGCRMLREIDEIDVLIMGHQHTLSAGIYNGKAYSQPGVDGSHISVIEIDAETREMTAELISVSDEKPCADRTIIDSISGDEAECQKWLDRTIGKSLVDLSIKNEDEDRLKKAQFITFINKVEMEYMDAEIAASSLFLGATGLGEEITMRDIVSSYAFPNTLVKKKITGKALKEYLEKTLEFWTVEDGRVVVSSEYLHPIPQHFNYDILDGVSYEAEISRPVGERLVSLTKDGRSIEDEEEFTIVLNNYRAAGGGNYPMLSELETVKEDLTNMVDVLSEYIERHGEIDFEPVYNVNIRV